METELILSICITSYNRLSELERCLNSIDCVQVSEIEIVVSEDHSPLRNEIKELVDFFSTTSRYKIVFNSNKINQGYDRNLGVLITLSSAKYILFISDDDCFSKNELSRLIEFLKQNEINAGFLPYYVGTQTGKLARRYTKGSFRINSDIESAEKHIYDSILFSGLIFKREKATSYSAERFKNLNYFQVYLFLTILTNFGAEYIDIPAIVAVSDGENAYGIAESSGGNKLLADRSSIFSLPEFHKGLIKVLKIYDEENNSRIIDAFSKEYSLRLYGRLSDSRKISKKNLLAYWKAVKSLEIKISKISYIYFVVLYVFGSDFSDKMFAIPKAILTKLRSVESYE